MRRLYVLALIALTAVGVLGSLSSAQAAPTDPFQYKYSFTDPQISSEGFSWEGSASIVVNHATGNVLILVRGVVHQFDSEGHPLDFPALGSSTVPAAGRKLIVDNTGGPNQGNFYVLNENDFLSFAPDGSTLANVRLNESLLPSAILGEGVMPDGSVRVVSSSEGTGIFSQDVNPLGEPVGSPIPFSPPLPLERWGTFVYDELGNLYLEDVPSYRKYNTANVELGATGLQNSGGYGEDPLAVNPSSNDVYVRGLFFKTLSETDNEPPILGIHYSDPLVESAPFDLAEGIQGIGPFGFDESGETLYIAEATRVGVFHREPPSPPSTLGTLSVSEIRSQAAILQGQLLSNGAAASYHFEYGPDTSYGNSTPSVSHSLTFYPIAAKTVMSGLRPNTVYHARIVLENAIGTRYGPDISFKTYPGPGAGADPCPNALARKQTSAQRLPDCRAYELVSAADAGGYEVESYLGSGQTPFPGFPRARDRLLYSTHAGAVPGPWNATNKGLDPYLATRTSGGWITQYEGLPADLNPAAGSFSSVLGEADSSLHTFAFAGPDLCSPCFGSGLQTGIPIHSPNGQLVQGMSGSQADSVPATAKPEGKVAKYFSGDGKHLLFASKYAFEPGANSGGDLTVYARDLAANTTEIVSTDPAGDALSGMISELDVSGDGSRVVIGKGMSTDSVGNEYVHPYLHIAGRPGSVDLAPLAGASVLYAGMTDDGSKVFFSSPDKLVGTDSDESADLYEAEVDGSGSLDLKAITAENANACNPVANSNGEHWNTTGSAPDCSAVAISGGVASATGAIYFLSPESLGGEGTLNQPNLYLAKATGSVSFVATLEPDNPLVLNSVKPNAARGSGDFQTTASGNYALFTSALQLTGVHTLGSRQAFRYGANDGQLTCSSCDTTDTTDASLAQDVELAPHGLSLLEDGRLFFSTRFPLALNDTNGRKDVYEWSGGAPQLISAGSGPFDSALLTASADGTDVFFFTHDVLAGEEDRNGQQTKIYDAREGGGFFKLPAGVPCQASDECHGAGTPAPGPANIKSSGKTTQGNVVVCPKNRVKKRGQCVKKKRAHAKKKQHRKKKKGAARKRAAASNGKRGGGNA